MSLFVNVISYVFVVAIEQNTAYLKTLRTMFYFMVFLPLVKNSNLGLGRKAGFFAHFCV